MRRKDLAIGSTVRRLSPEGDLEATDKLDIDGIQISPASRIASCDGQELHLTSVEFELLLELLKEAGKIVKKEDLSENVLERKLSPYDRSLDMHVSNLRRKLGPQADGQERIKTVRGVGYIYSRN